MWIDAHCHLQFDDTWQEAVERAVAAGVDRLICVGTDAKTSEEAAKLAQAAGERVRAAIGLHPHDAKNGIDPIVALVDEWSKSPSRELVAIGECGLDYFYEHSPRDVQKEMFVAQIELAKRYDLALVIHTRDAWDDTFALLRSEGVPPRTVIHCFTGGPEEARIALDLGLHLSFSGIVTFKKSTEVQEAARMCPTDRMTVETDSPFLAPVPHRGRPNEPSLVGLVGGCISELKDMQVERFASTVSAVTEQLFNLRSLSEANRLPKVF
jgi:TatD DNase family protein